MWKKGSLAFWNQVEVRLQQLLHGEPRLRGDQPQLEKLGWHIDQRWHDGAVVSKESYKMLFNMMWGQHDQEHIQVLMNYAKKQRDLHQSTSFAAETEMYSEWLAKASLTFMRPFQQLPRQERMAKRVQQWGEIWGIRGSERKVTALPALIENARSMQPLCSRLQRSRCGTPLSSCPIRHRVWMALALISSRPCPMLQ